MMNRRFQVVLSVSIGLLVANEGLMSQDVPLVYEVEHTGADYPPPILPSIDDLPVIQSLPDPFAWSDGSGRSTKLTDWSRRRSEIKAEIEHYEIGEKPARPENISANFRDNTLTVTIEVNGQSLKLTANVWLPEGDGPFPAAIGIGRGSGSLPPDIFTRRDIAMIAFDFSQVMSHTQTRGKEPINRLYPDQTEMGAYSAWPWGISRIIDGLELVESDLPIDREHLAVTGCSFAGKMALFAGALDERIALTIAQEPGGGGAAAWRVSETLGNVETLGKTSRAWFLEDMFRFSNSVEKLPHDHHELMALVAPRALLVLGNPDYEWLADESGFVSCMAAKEVWKSLGVPDRFGFSIVADHPHCQLPDNQRPEVEAFADKFLLGKTDIETSVARHPFEKVEPSFWYDGWATGTSTFPDRSKAESHSIEAESASHGSEWIVGEDQEASNGKFLTVRDGLESTDNVPSGDNAKLQYPITIGKQGRYYLYARLNCPSADDDSFWIQIDNQEFIAANGLRTNGWQWVKLDRFDLTPGNHTLTIAYREDGAKIDKVTLTTYVFGPIDPDN